MILFLVDASDKPSKEDHLLYASIQDRPHLLVLNKIDIAASGIRNQYAELFPESKCIESSTKTGEGLDNLEQAIFDQVTGGGMQWDPGHALLPNVRHQQSIQRAAGAVSGAIGGLVKGDPADLVAVDVQAVLGHLGDVVGESTPDDVLDVIFENFCSKENS